MAMTEIDEPRNAKKKLGIVRGLPRHVLERLVKTNRPDYMSLEELKKQAVQDWSDESIETITSYLRGIS